ncbi:hypothetical protein ACIBUY_08020 [Streptomyces sp. NPDC050085]|uniref:hypothetical protein n=1 Tax=Streptomyces sp. NPDC050085 TaxID=3365600 RepID=UPI0037B71933
MTTSQIDGLLAKIRLRERPYGAEEITAAEARLTARIANRMWHSVLTFDDHIQGAGVQLPRPQRRPDAHERATQSDYAASDLRVLCRSLVGTPQSLHEMSSFISNRILEPSGAVVLGCVLQLAGRDDSARFWWQFAAGAGCRPAVHCLYLHHLSLGETQEADWWRAFLTQDQPDEPDLVICENEDFHLTMPLRRAPLPQAAEAVVGYVPTAIEYVDAVDLPLPTAGFAERIEELAGTP